MADPGIDPRYAAQFQRGYDPAVHPAPPVAPTTAREAPVRLPGGPPPSAPLVAGAPPRVTREPEPEQDRPTDAAAEPVASALTSTPEETTASPAERFEWALLAVGVALVLVAGLLFWQAAGDIRQYVGVTDPGEQSAIMVRNSLPGPLLVGAVVAVTAWIVLRATRGVR